LRDKINENPEIIEKVEEVITLDVQRSFNNTESISSENLSNILKTYAFYNPEIEYCQGMNFLAGFFYFYYRDEEKSFKAMLGLIKKFDLTELFNTTLPRLKLYFYILDRLISMYLPELHEHFKNEYINSSLFSSAWFITCFCNTISHQRTADINENLMLFWDNFIIDGYLVIFRVAIILLGIFEDKLLPLSFEEMLNCIVDIPKILFSKNEAIEELFDSENVNEEEEEKRQIDGDGEEIILFEQSPLKKTDIIEVLRDIDFKELLKNSCITQELLQKIEFEYKENESKGNFN
jgi:ecotropic viral integration site 5 protein